MILQKDCTIITIITLHLCNPFVRSLHQCCTPLYAFVQSLPYFGRVVQQAHYICTRITLLLYGHYTTFVELYKDYINFVQSLHYFCRAVTLHLWNHYLTFVTRVNHYISVQALSQFCRVITLLLYGHYITFVRSLSQFCRVITLLLYGHYLIFVESLPYFDRVITLPLQKELYNHYILFKRTFVRVIILVLLWLLQGCRIITINTLQGHLHYLALLDHYTTNFTIFRFFLLQGHLTNPKQSTKRKKNHSTQDSRVVPHHGTNWAALWLTAQIGRDAVLSESYGRGQPRAPHPLFIQFIVTL